MQLLSFGEIIDQSWALYRSNWKTLMKISSIILIVLLLQFISILLLPDSRLSLFDESKTLFGWLSVALALFLKLIISPLVGLMVFISLVKSIQNFISNAKVNEKEVLIKSVRVLPSVVIVSFLFGFFLFLAQFISLGPGFLFGSIGIALHQGWFIFFANILLLFGLVLTAYLTPRWFIQFAFAPYACILDRVKGKMALQKSSQFTKNRFWIVFPRFILPKFVFSLFGLAIATLLGLLLTPAKDTGLFMTFFYQQTPLLVSILIQPLFFASDVILYQSLKQNYGTNESS